MLGFTPPEWAYLTTQRTGVEVTQGFARTLDRNIRMAPSKPLSGGEVAKKRIRALVDTACQLLNSAVPEVGRDKIHRLDKADTIGGMGTIRALSVLGAPYAMLLYERFLGQPYAGHRDSVSVLMNPQGSGSLDQGRLLPSFI